MSLQDNEIYRQLPLTPYVFQILLALAEGDKHGYGVIVDVRERTGGRIAIGTGTLYTALARLLKQELIEERSAPKGTPTSVRDKRRFYGLTPLGRAVAAAEAERLAVIVEVARERQLLGKRT